MNDDDKKKCFIDEIEEPDNEEYLNFQKKLVEDIIKYKNNLSLFYEQMPFEFRQDLSFIKDIKEIKELENFICKSATKIEK